MSGHQDEQNGTCTCAEATLTQVSESFCPLRVPEEGKTQVAKATTNRIFP